MKINLNLLDSRIENFDDNFKENIDLFVKIKINNQKEFRSQIYKQKNENEKYFEINEEIIKNFNITIPKNDGLILEFKIFDFDEMLNENCLISTKEISIKNWKKTTNVFLRNQKLKLENKNNEIGFLNFQLKILF